MFSSLRGQKSLCKFFHGHTSVDYSHVRCAVSMGGQKGCSNTKVVRAGPSTSLKVKYTSYLYDAYDDF